MLLRSALVFFCSVILAAPLRAEPAALAIQPGEKFTYRLAWGPFRKAASLQIVADRDPEAEFPTTRITTHTATRGLIRALYQFDGWGQFFYEPDEGRLLSAKAWTETSSKKTNASMSVDYQEGMAHYVDHLRPHRSIDIALPEVQVFDFLTTLLQIRDWEFAVGDELPVSVFFDDELYDLVITIEERATIKTPLGKREAVLVMPHMPVEPKGMFEDGGEIKVWVSDDELRLPLRFEVKVPVGTAMAVLTEHRPADAGQQAQPATSLTAAK